MLGTNTNDYSEEHIETVVVEDYDEDAITQEKIWNSLLRDRLSEESKSIYKISGSVAKSTVSDIKDSTRASNAFLI